MQQHMHCIIPYIFGCWTDLVVHLLLLKSSMDKPVNMSRGQGLTGADEVHPEAKRDDIFVE